MSERFFNTTGEAGADLRKYDLIAGCQDDTLLAFFQLHHNQDFTRSELHKQVMTDSPVSSITRAMSSLKDRGLIEKTDNMRAGDYGRKQHTWQLKQTAKGENYALF